MEIMNLVYQLIGFIILMIGVIMIYHARKLAKKWFSFGDQNEGAKWFKIGGFVISMVGLLPLWIFPIS